MTVHALPPAPRVASGYFFQRFEAEIGLVFRLVSAWLSVGLSGTTYGARLFRLIYRRLDRDGNLRPLSGSQKLAWAGVHVILPYIWSRVIEPRAEAAMAGSQASLDTTGARFRRLAARMLLGVGRVVHVLRLINFVVFLAAAGGKTGGASPANFSSLGDRLVGARLVFADQPRMLAVRTGYVNRQIAWGELSRLAAVVIPLLSLGRAQKRIGRTTTSVVHWLRSAWLFAAHGDDRSGLWWKEAGNGNNYGDSTLDGGSWTDSDTLLGSDPCPLCHRDPRPRLPFAAACGHVFCYYCARSNMLADPGFTCPTCAAPVSDIVPCGHRLRAG